MSRIERVTAAIKREVSLIIQDELKDPRIGFVTITGVELTADLRSAKIFYSVLGNEDAYKNTREALESASGFIRKHLAERINLRFALEIMFKEDHSTEDSVRIQQILEEIKHEDEPSKKRRVRKKE
ncbi:MAG: 30S ribosome-binding factor RbfA [Candidatus Omnitrophica bacterium]|nr:30S ribosome-binding factor RbfA [Candidatus Omnitrophota bacterium]